jgi:hypothetical protein
MVEDEIVSEAELLDRLRRRTPVFADTAEEQSGAFQEIDLEFRLARQKRSDIGVLNHARNLFLEPRNPFEPSRRRKPKMEAVVFGALFTLVAIAVLAFNLAAPAP